MSAQRTYRSGDGFVTNVIVVDQEKYDSGPFEFDGLLETVLDSLMKIRETIPDEFRDIATCEIDSVGGYEGSHYARIGVEYDRPATPAETAAASHAEQVRATMNEQRERAIFETLKAKFGD